MDAEKFLKSYNLNLASIEYFTNLNKSIEVALGSLQPKEKDILVMTYIHRLPLKIIQDKAKYKETQYYKIRNSAIAKLDKIINTQTDEKIEVVDFLNSYVSNIHTITYLTSMNNSIERVLDALEPIEKKVIILRYFENKRVAELKVILQYSERSIFNFIKSALKKINQILNPMEKELCS